MQPGRWDEQDLPWLLRALDRFGCELRIDLASPVFNTEFITFNAKFIILNAKIII